MWYWRNTSGEQNKAMITSDLFTHLAVGVLSSLLSERGLFFVVVKEPSYFETTPHDHIALMTRTAQL